MKCIETLQEFWKLDFVQLKASTLLEKSETPSSKETDLKIRKNLIY